jgi:hypothetical protein
LQEFLFENVENLAPFHFVDVFDGNVPINGVLLNVGHNVSTIQKDPFDGSFFGGVSHVIVVDIVFTQEVSIFTGFVVMVLSFHVKIFDNEFFNRMFDLELLKFRADLQRIYGQQSLEPINVNITFRNVFNNL